MDKPERRHIGELQWPFAQTGAVAGAGRTELGNVTERIGTEIAKGLGVGCTADAEGVEDEEKDTRH
jgi:hypothetical protein